MQMCFFVSLHYIICFCLCLTIAKIKHFFSLARGDFHLGGATVVVIFDWHKSFSMWGKRF